MHTGFQQPTTGTLNVCVSHPSLACSKAVGNPCTHCLECTVTAYCQFSIMLSLVCMSNPLSFRDSGAFPISGSPTLVGSLPK